MNKIITIRLPLEKEYLRNRILMEFIKIHSDWQLNFEPYQPQVSGISVQACDDFIAQSCLRATQKMLSKFEIFP